MSLIVWLNMFIVILGDAFGKIRERQQQSNLLEIINVVVENFFVVNRDIFSKD